MKFLVKTLTSVFLSFLSIPFLAETKQIDLHFDHTVHQEVFINSPLDDRTLETPWHDTDHTALNYCQKLTIENKGDELIINCLPFVNQPSFHTLESLKHDLLSKDNPLLALYALWNHSLHVSSSIHQQVDDPLDLLNFVGGCDQEDYARYFNKLCAALAISVRPAGIHGKDCYDFCYQETWNLLDLFTDQIYLGLDNRSLASSEDVMDDPFLVLRTKDNRKAVGINFQKAWHNLAHFEIVTPFLGEPVAFTPPSISRDKKGFDLYPGEKVVYQYQNDIYSLPTYQRLIQHELDLKARLDHSQINYVSPFPINAILNSSSYPIFLNNQAKLVQPGETVSLADTLLFNLQISLDQEEVSGRVVIFSTCSQRLLPQLGQGINHVNLGSEANPTTIEVTYDLDSDLEALPVCSLKVTNETSLFDHCTPCFHLEKSSEDSNIQTIWWQISLSPEFDLIPSNFEQVEPFTATIELPIITDTFFNADETYYFRIKGCSNGTWGSWSEPFIFSVKKPQPITDITFEKIDYCQYEISWKGHSDTTDYLIFGSNALDFIPSFYYQTQINALVDGEVIEMEDSQNLVAITSEPRFIADGSLAYYRIVSRHKGQLSVPSPLIHVYDQGLFQTRTVLQLIELNDQHVIAQRTSFPPGYEWMEPAYSVFSFPVRGHFFEHKFIKPPLAFSAEPTYEKGPYVSTEIWDKVKPYLLPDNHPVKSRLDRMFSSDRIILSSDSFKRAGFKRYKPGRFSRIMASSHPNLLGYFIKAFADTELGIKEDWKKFIHRIEGAKAIRACIVRHHYQDRFKVPNKWIYPLPKSPSPPNSDRYLRKNFILVAEDMKIWDHDTNEAYYKKRMTRALLHAYYTILQEEGLYDSVYAFNVPFCKDGKIAFIDTEYHHRWPIPFHKLERYLSSDMKRYWRMLTASPENREQAH